MPSPVVPEAAAVETDAAPSEPTQQLDEAQQSEPPHLAEGETTAVPPTPAKKLSALDAAAQVLRESAEPMTTKQMIEALAARGLWTSPGGKTPHATLFSAILREISRKGTESRFVKAARGTFASSNTRA